MRCDLATANNQSCVEALTSWTPHLKPRWSKFEHLVFLLSSSCESCAPAQGGNLGVIHVISPDDSTSLMASEASLFLPVPSCLLQPPTREPENWPQMWIWWCLFWLKPFFGSSCDAKSKPLGSLTVLPGLMSHTFSSVLCPSSTLNCL